MTNEGKEAARVMMLLQWTVGSFLEVWVGGRKAVYISKVQREWWEDRSLFGEGRG